MSTPIIDNSSFCEAEMAGFSRSFGGFRGGRYVDRVPQMHRFESRQALGSEEIYSKILLIQSKKFYLDVKQNNRGKFVKISEIGATGFRNKMVFDMSAASDFHEMLTSFIEEYATIGPLNSGGDTREEKIRSEVILAGERRYYLDLKQNSRGRFLKVAMTMPPERQQIMIPAQGMIDIRDALTDILSSYGSQSNKRNDSSDLKPDETSLTLPAITNKSDTKLSFKSDQKTFQFNVSSNQRGQFLRISEVSETFNRAVNIPQSLWTEFVNKLDSLTPTILNDISQPSSYEYDNMSANIML